MSFKLWLENELDKNFSITYDLSKKKWDKRNWGNNNSISIIGQRPSEHRAEGYIDIEGIGRHNPKLSEVLSELLRQYPDLSDYPIKFDGPAMETVEQVLQRVSREDYEGMPQMWYHGTSTWHWDKIQTEGLKPRTQTNVAPSYQMGAKAGNSNYIYLMDNDGNAVRFAAREAATKASGVAIILKIDSNKLRMKNFRPDEDSNTSQWQNSLWGMGAVAYDGNIPSEAIKPHMILKDGKWVVY